MKNIILVVFCALASVHVAMARPEQLAFRLELTEVAYKQASPELSTVRVFKNGIAEKTCKSSSGKACAQVVGRIQLSTDYVHYIEKLIKLSHQGKIVNFVPNKPCLAVVPFKKEVATADRSSSIGDQGLLLYDGHECIGGKKNNSEEADELLKVLRNLRIILSGPQPR